MFNQELYSNEQAKAIQATTLLTGMAFSWVEPYIQDYQTNLAKGTLDNISTETDAVLGSFIGFKEHITRIFGEIDRKHAAV